VRRSAATALLVVPLLFAACGTTVDGSSDASTRAALGADTARALAEPGAAENRFPMPTRAVADIVAPRWSNEDDRDDAGEAQRVLDILAPREGMHIADIGAGDGYYVARLAPRVGSTGRVYGEDIVPRYLDLLSARKRESGWTNVDVVRGEAHDPRLPENTLDAAILIHMYHEISQPFGLLWNLATAMKPGGRVVILDLDRPTWGHGTPIGLLRCELAAVGYREESVDRSVPGEYVATFLAPSNEERPTPEAITTALGERPCTAQGARE
jgi:SAM-dependent methyltransferase